MKSLPLAVHQFSMRVAHVASGRSASAAAMAHAGFCRRICRNGAFATAATTTAATTRTRQRAQRAGAFASSSSSSSSSTAAAFGFSLGLGLGVGAGVGFAVAGSVANNTRNNKNIKIKNNSHGEDFAESFAFTMDSEAHAGRPWPTHLHAEPPSQQTSAALVSIRTTDTDEDPCKTHPSSLSPSSSSETLLCNSSLPHMTSRMSLGNTDDNADYDDDDGYAHRPSHIPNATHDLALPTSTATAGLDLQPMSLFTTSTNNTKSQPSSSTRKPHTSSPTTTTSFIADAVEKVIHSVVNISVETDTSTLFESKTLVSSGSGFFVHDNGSILTNAHVVADMSESSKLWVTTTDGSRHRGIVHSMDTLSDLAIIQLEDHESDGNGNGSLSQHQRWQPVMFGTNKDLRLGDWVIAIGSPFGLQNTVTAGVVSSQSRRSDEIGTTDRDTRVEYIQTDCVVHSGSSGGPLVNLDGHVIGINTTRAESEGISFAIRMDNAREMVEQLMVHGRVMRPWLGIQMVTLSPQVWTQIEQGAGGGSGRGRGIGGGIGDGFPIPSNALGDPSFDPAHPMDRQRGSHNGTNNNKGSKRSLNNDNINSNDGGGTIGSPTHTDPNGNLSSRANPNHQIPHINHGVLVTHVEHHSPAHASGLLSGDVITSVNGYPVTSSQDLLNRIGLRVGDAFELTVKRCVPVDMDWDGRTLRYEEEERVVSVTPGELDVFLRSGS